MLFDSEGIDWYPWSDSNRQNRTPQARVYAYSTTRAKLGAGCGSRTRKIKFLKLARMPIPSTRRNMAVR